MLVAILSDIHSNLEALEAVLADADARGADAVWALGDLVGYGADPHAVLARLGQANAFLIGGNHDLCATGRFDVAWFNRAAADAIRWTMNTLPPEDLALLASLEPRAERDGALLVHGSVPEPATEYVTSVDVAARSFDAEPFGTCFFGHTHVPTVFHLDGERVRSIPMADGDRFEPAGRAMINPGSVGQPRDGDPRASYLVWDGHAAVNHRVPYEVARAQAKIRDAGLPASLADRLASGR